jgi:hypothetical protein
MNVSAEPTLSAIPKPYHFKISKTSETTSDLQNERSFRIKLENIFSFTLDFKFIFSFMFNVKSSSTFEVNEDKTKNDSLLDQPKVS